MPAANESSVDHELMLRVRDGDIAKLGVLFERHHTSLYGYFVRLTRDRFTSEDLVQLVFYRIMRFRQTYRDDGNFAAWMYQIARTTLAHHWRRTAATSGHENSGDLETISDHAPHAADSASKSDEAHLLQRALAALSADEREIVVLSRIRELHYDDIAQLLNISVGAVKVRVHRAMKQLRHTYRKLSEAGRPCGPKTNATP